MPTVVVFFGFWDTPDFQNILEVIPTLERAGMRARMLFWRAERYWEDTVNA